MEPLDCAIVGAGPAGLTAATYLARYHRRVRVFDGGDSRARWIPRTHNCPGYPHGISGRDLLQRLRDQAHAHDVPFERTRIRRVHRDATGFSLLDGQRQWRARTVLLATGVNDVMPEMADLEPAIACGAIRLCAICDAYEVTDGRIAVLGPAARALEHAIFLRAYSASVGVIPISAAEQASEDEAWRARAGQHGVRPWPSLQRLRLQDGQCVAEFADGRRAAFDTVYPVLGALPETSLASDLGAGIAASGELRTDARGETSVRGLFAAGDVVSDLNQIAVAMGHAAIAATAIHRRLPPHPREARQGDGDALPS